MDSIAKVSSSMSPMAPEYVMETWLQEQVGSAFDALKSDPTRVVTVDQIRARLLAEHRVVTTRT